MTTADRTVVYSIAGSDSSGGAGIQADLATFANFGVHGCAVTTALTAQNRRGVHSILPTPVSHLEQEFASLVDDIPPHGIKLGMLGSSATVAAVTCLLAGLQDRGFAGPVVCDPVLAASAGGSLMHNGGTDALLGLFPHLSLITPNCDEAAQLTGLAIDNFADMERAASALLEMGAESVLLTGGHLDPTEPWCYDYFVSRTDLEHPNAFWLRGERVPTRHNHGTGCTLSSAITAAMALGLEMADAIVLGKMAVTRGLRHARGLAGGPGPVAHPGWPSGLENLPAILPCRPDQFRAPTFRRCDTHRLGLYPVVDSVDWVERLLAEGVKTLQLRIKDMPEAGLRQAISDAVALQNRHGGRLFINDHWQLAVEFGAYGVHLGQEDMDSADFDAIARAGLRLGLSNHAWYEFARAHALAPSYMAIGPVYHTPTKAMRFAPRGLGQLQEWVDLLAPGYPVTAIGGIDLARAPAVAETGVGSIAVVRAVTQSDDYRGAVAQLSRILDTSQQVTQ